MDQVITLDGVKYPIVVSYTCIRRLGNMYDFTSPTETLEMVSNTLQPIFKGLEVKDGEPTKEELAEIDPNTLSFDVVELFRKLALCAVYSANDEATLDIPEESSLIFFTNNALAFGELITAFVEANVAPEAVAEAKKNRGPKNQAKKPPRKSRSA